MVATRSAAVIVIASHDKINVIKMSSFWPIRLTTYAKTFTTSAADEVSDKRRPGRVTFASAGIGTSNHLTGEYFQTVTGTKLVHVPYKGSGPALVDLMGGQVDMMFDAISTIISHVNAGKLKALGTTGKSRSAVTPNIPTVSEAGLPGYEATIWLGLMAPAATPRPILERLSGAVNKVINAPEVKENWSKQGAVPMGMTPDEFGKFVRDDATKWAKLVKDTGMKVD